MQPDRRVQLLNHAQVALFEHARFHARACNLNVEHSDSSLSGTKALFYFYIFIRYIYIRYWDAAARFAFILSSIVGVIVCKAGFTFIYFIFDQLVSCSASEYIARGEQYCEHWLELFRSTVPVVQLVRATTTNVEQKEKFNDVPFVLRIQRLSGASNMILFKLVYLQNIQFKYSGIWLWVHFMQNCVQYSWSALVFRRAR